MKQLGGRPTRAHGLTKLASTRKILHGEIFLFAFAYADREGSPQAGVKLIPMRMVLISDLPGNSTAIEERVFAKVNARIHVAERGDEAELLELVSRADAILT